MHVQSLDCELTVKAYSAAASPNSAVEDLLLTNAVNHS